MFEQTPVYPGCGATTLQIVLTKLVNVGIEGVKPNQTKPNKPCRLCAKDHAVAK